MTFPELADFFFTSQPSVVKLECFEISHPSFSQTHRICRNSGADLRVSHADALPPIWEWDGIDDKVLMGDVLGYERHQSFTLSAFIRADSITQWGAGFPQIFNRLTTASNRQIAWGINPTNGRVRLHMGGVVLILERVPACLMPNIDWPPTVSTDPVRLVKR